MSSPAVPVMVHSVVCAPALPPLAAITSPANTMPIAPLVMSTSPWSGRFTPNSAGRGAFVTSFAAVRTLCEHTFDGRGRAAHARRRGPPARAPVHAPRTRRPDRGGRLPLRPAERAVGARPPAGRRGGPGRPAARVALGGRGGARRLGGG